MPNLFETLGPDATVCVLPRYLAGSGPPDLRTAWPFPFDEDWTLHQPEEGTAVASSPCLRLRAGYVTAPGSPGRAQWITAAHKDPFGPATWQITFDSSTPVELVHDAHAALLDLYREGRDSFSNALFRYSLTQYGAYAPLLARGWSHLSTPGAPSFSPPLTMRAALSTATPPPRHRNPPTRSGKPGEATGRTLTGPRSSPG